jgi:putative NIF3 family GTP cyclohydrolase 1 type 2
MTLAAAAARVGTSPDRLRRLLDGQYRPTLTQENAIRALVGFAALRHCPICKGYGRVGYTTAEVDLATALERVRTENRRMEEKLRVGRARMEIMHDAIRDAGRADSLANAREILADALVALQVQQA